MLPYFTLKCNNFLLFSSFSVFLYAPFSPSIRLFYSLFLLKIYHANFIFQTKTKRFLCTFHKNRPAAILRFSALFSLLIEYMVSNYGSLYDAVILSEIQAAHRNIAV